VDELVERLVLGVGLDNTCFNVELMVHGTQLYVIEIHARPSTQFAWHIEHATGQNPLQDACMIALGQQPVARKAQPVSNVACCCVMRIEHDALVTRVPLQTEIEAIQSTYPHVQIIVLVQVGKRLSDYRQDSDTFRYCLINAAGGSFEEIKKLRVEIEKQLQFTFA